MIEAVFFDAGDTLLRPAPSFPALAAKVITQRGHAVSEQEVVEAARTVQGHFRRVEGENLSAAGKSVNRRFWRLLYADMLAELDIHDEGGPTALVDTFSDPAHYDLFPDAIPVLDELADAGLRLGVISNFEPWLGGLLERLQVHHRFDVIAISGELGIEKPDPRIFEWAVREMGVAAARCVHVGDQPYFDADPALSCGLAAVLIDRYDRFADMRTPYPRVESLTDLPAVIEGMS